MSRALGLTSILIGVCLLVFMPESARAQGQTNTLWLNGQPVHVTSLGNGFEAVRIGNETYQVMRVGNIVRYRQSGGPGTGFGGSPGLSLLQGLLEGMAQARQAKFERAQNLALRVLEDNPGLSREARWCVEVFPFVILKPDFQQAYQGTCAATVRDEVNMQRYVK